MTPKFNAAPKSETELAYQDAKDLARAEVRRLTRRITDRLYVAIDREFKQAVLEGRAIEVRPDLDAILADAGVQADIRETLRLEA
jgi:hypothetical protein